MFELQQDHFNANHIKTVALICLVVDIKKNEKKKKLADHSFYVFVHIYTVYIITVT